MSKELFERIARIEAEIKVNLEREEESVHKRIDDEFRTIDKATSEKISSLKTRYEIMLRDEESRLKSESDQFLSEFKKFIDKIEALRDNELNTVIQTYLDQIYPQADQ